MNDGPFGKQSDRMNSPASSEEDFWVFGYGSLMWRPGFPYVERRHATLPGFHRRFCIRSVIYRGTPAQPGLVLGIDVGGECQGMAFRIDASHREEVIKYLYDRELPLNVYTPQWVSIVTGGQTVEALTFVVNRDHDQFVYLPDEEVASIIACCTGASGSNFEYLENTVRALHELGVPDPELDALYARASALLR